MSDSTTSDAHFQFFTVGIQYYVVARFGAMAKLIPVAGNLYHHAVEMLLKGQLAKSHTLEQLKKNYSHRLSETWAAFKGLFPAEDLSTFDSLIVALDRFERIRYPDNVLKEGMAATIGWTPAPPRRLEGQGANVPQYELAVTVLDRLVGELFRLCSINPAAYMSHFNLHAVAVLENENPSCKGWFPERERGTS